MKIRIGIFLILQFSIIGTRFTKPAIGSSVANVTGWAKAKFQVPHAPILKRVR